MTRTDLLQLYLRLGLTLIPVKPRSKVPQVKWGDGWNPTGEEQIRWSPHIDLDRRVCLGPNPAILYFNSMEALYVYSSDPTYFGQEVDHG